MIPSSPSSTLEGLRFASDLLKEAADVGLLAQRLLRARGVHLSTPLSHFGGGAFTVPTRRQVPLVAKAKYQGEIASASTPRTEELRDEALAIRGMAPGAGTDALRAAYHRKVEDGSKHVRRELEGYGPHGSIQVHPPRNAETLSKWTGIPVSPHGDDQRALLATTVAHEMFERGIRPAHASPFHSHISPDVLLQEHNLLSKLEGPGADHARQVYRALRKNTGEAEQLRGALRHKLGPAAPQFLDEGQKIPKAMRRSLQRQARASGERRRDITQVPPPRTAPAVSADTPHVWSPKATKEPGYWERLKAEVLSRR
jgi:hypothetical protein